MPCYTAFPFICGWINHHICDDIVTPLFDRDQNLAVDAFISESGIPSLHDGVGPCWVKCPDVDHRLSNIRLGYVFVSFFDTRLFSKGSVASSSV